MPLKGDAKRDYMREYMRRKRAADKAAAIPGAKTKAVNDRAALAAALAEIKSLKAALLKAKPPAAKKRVR